MLCSLPAVPPLSTHLPTVRYPPWPRPVPVSHGDDLGVPSLISVPQTEQIVSCQREMLEFLFRVDSNRNIKSFQYCYYLKFH